MQIKAISWCELYSFYYTNDVANSCYTWSYRDAINEVKLDQSSHNANFKENFLFGSGTNFSELEKRSFVLGVHRTLLL